MLKLKQADPHGKWRMAEVYPTQIMVACNCDVTVAELAAANTRDVVVISGVMAASKTPVELRVDDRRYGTFHVLPAYLTGARIVVRVGEALRVACPDAPLGATAILQIEVTRDCV